jgi:hypothetical protein
MILGAQLMSGAIFWSQIGFYISPDKLWNAKKFSNKTWNSSIIIEPSKNSAMTIQFSIYQIAFTKRLHFLTLT